MIEHVSLRHIGAFLHEQAALLPATCHDDSRFSCVVPGTGLRLTCRGDADSVRIMADKFIKGLPHSLTHHKTTKRSARRRFSSQVLQMFIDDGELDNAQEYLRLHGMTDHDLLREAA